MRHLMLMRHAKAESETKTGTDVDRALSLAGRSQAKALGPLLYTRGTVPQVVLCSGANRAVQTWKLTAAGLAECGVDAQALDVRFLQEIYTAGPAELLDLIHALPPHISSALVIGHEPVMSHVARVLAGPDSAEAPLHTVAIGMATAQTAFLDTEASWADLGRGQATLTALDRPAPKE